MATASDEHVGHDVNAIKVGIIGNSNSVMHNSYVRILEATPGLAVSNRSIGSSPNVVLLEFLGHETDIDYDFIIIETAVVDFIQGGFLYPRGRSLETLDLFVAYVRAASKAQIIILTIPTRYALLAPDAYWQEQLYRDTAARLGIPILDGFRLLRRLIGEQKMAAVATYHTRAEQLVAAFGLPRNRATAIAWRDLRDRHVQTNPLGVSAFVDHAHFSGGLHALVGTILADFMVTTGPDRTEISDRVKRPVTRPVMEVYPNGDGRLVRTSSLMSRELIALGDGGTTRYECPRGYYAYGLLVNQSMTFCFLQLTSPTGSVAFDMRFNRQPFDWIGIVVPIVDRIGNGVIEVTALNAPPDSVPGRQLHNTGMRPNAWGAEIGEMILVRDDWRDRLVVPVSGDATAFHLEDTAAGQRAIDTAADWAAPIVQGIESDGRFIPGDCSTSAADLLTNATVPLSLADQARLLLLLGMNDRLPAFLAAAISQQPGSEELKKMHDALQKLASVSDNSNNLPSGLNISDDILPAPSDTHPATPLLPTQENASGPASAPQAAKPARDAPLAAWILAAEQPDAGDPIALLEEALERFPDATRLFHDLARANEKRQNWPAAEMYWRHYIARDDRLWWVYAALAAAVRAQGRGTEAHLVLQDGVSRLPAEPQMLAEVARTAQVGAGFAEAIRLWDLVIARFPDRWIGYRGKAQVLVQNGEPGEADQLTETFAPPLAGDIDALHDLARLAERQRDWKRAETLWRAFLDLEQRGARAYLALARSLREQSLYAEAEAVLRDALPRFPNDADLAAEAAQCTELLGNLPDSERQSQAVDHKPPADNKEASQPPPPTRTREPNYLGSVSLIDQLTRDGKYAEARQAMSDLIDQGANSRDLLQRAIKLTLTDDGFAWIRTAWPKFVKSNPDRQTVCHEAYILLKQNYTIRDCAFLVVWAMPEPWPDRISEIPPLVRIISQSRGTAHSGIVDKAIVQNLHLVVDPMMRDVVNCMLLLDLQPRRFDDLITHVLQRATEQDMPTEFLITLVGSGGAHPAFKDAINRHLGALIEATTPLATDDDARIYLLLIVGDILFPSAKAALLAKLRRERARRDKPESLNGVLSLMAHARESRPLPPTPPLSRLKICLCFSGQLRGYEAGFASWRDSGIWNHDVTVVAHVWRDIGLRPPDSRHNAARAFSGAFLAEYGDVLDTHGWRYILDHYPALVQQLTAANHIDEPQLKALYGAKAMVVDDEAQSEFNGKHNFWKMYYKVKMAHQLGRSVCPDADLYIRARPDQDISTFVSIDWQKLAQRAYSDNVIFTDSDRFFAAPWIWMDDRLAVGSGPSMDIYSATFDHVAQASANQLYGFPTKYMPHGGFGSTTQYFDVDVERLPYRPQQSYRLLNPHPMDPKKVIELIRADIHVRVESQVDTRLLSALIADLLGTRS